jgi:hypothetical protein
MNKLSRYSDDQAVEARLGARLASGLTFSAEQLPHDLATRLRFAREKAVERARELRLAPAAADVIVVGTPASGRAARLASNVSWWQRAASVLPLLVLLAGLLMIDHWSAREQVLSAADIDSQLLADDLPPAAYSDPGFAEYLRTAPAP